MKKILTLLLIACTLGAFSQGMKVEKAEITAGKPYRVVDAFYKIYIQKGGKILTFKRTMKTLKMQLFDVKTLTELNTKDIVDLPKGYHFECIKEFKGTYFLFYSLWDKPNKKEQLFCREIDFDNFGFKGTDKLLVKVDGKVTDFKGEGGISFNIFTGFGATDIDKFNVQTSFDSTKVLIQYRRKPTEKKDKLSKDIIGLYVFNNKMESIYGDEYTMPYTESKMNNMDYSIDSEGNVYTLATVFNDDDSRIKKYKDGKPNFRLELLCVQQNVKDFRITKIEVGTNIVTDLWLFETTNKQMICAGFYSEAKNTKYSGDLDDASGIFMFKTDKNGEAKNVQTYKIPVEVINQYLTDKEQAKNEKADKNDKTEFRDLQLRQLIIQKDGSIIIVGEQYYLITYQSYSGNTSHTEYESHYNDMLIAKIDANGKLAWMKKLPKRQKGGLAQGGLSYKYINSNNNHYLVFLDNVKNLTLPTNKKPATHQDGAGGFLTAYKVSDASGEVSKVSLLDTKDFNDMKLEQFKVDRVLKTGEDQFVVEFYKNQKEDILIKANFSKK